MSTKKLVISKKRGQSCTTSRTKHRSKSLRDMFLLEPDITHLNHGCYGACPIPVLRAYQKWQLELERNPVHFFNARLPELMLWARSKLADHVKCHPNDLVFVSNSTTGLNTVIRSLRLEPGDEILATDEEYGALELTWQHVCEKTGSIYKRHQVALPVSDPKTFVEDLWDRVTLRTRVIFISHVAAPTGLIFPIEEIIRRSRERGIVSIIDGAHALGQIPLDLRKLQPDVYVSSAHKWLCAPRGSAFLYVRKELQKEIMPLVISWGYGMKRRGLSQLVVENQWQGTRDFAPFLATCAAIDFQAKHGWDTVKKRAHALVQQARNEMAALTGLHPVSADSNAWYSQMSAIPLFSDNRSIPALRPSIQGIWC